MSEKRLRGFAAMTPERRLEVQRRGAAAMRAAGKAYEYDHDSGKRAGRLGGLASQAARRRAKGAEDAGLE